MTDAQHFAVSTRLFNESKFLEGLQKIDKAIQYDPQNSVLYSNRALFLIEIGHTRQAIKDLKYSIELDKLNFISYFNLFSIHVRESDLELAAQELHCALSAIYLIAGKEAKSYEFVAKAIYYAKNNTEARVLKGLMDLENGNFKQAHEQLVWACGIQTDSIMLARVRDLIKKIENKTLKSDEDSSSQISQKRDSRRLQSAFKTYKFDDIEAEIRDRIIEFNQLYKIVIQKEDLITEKIWERGSKKDVFMRQRSVGSHSNTEKEENEEESRCSRQMSDSKEIMTISNEVIDTVIDSMFSRVEALVLDQNPQQILSNSTQNQLAQGIFLKQAVKEQETSQYFQDV